MDDTEYKYKIYGKIVFAGSDRGPDESPEWGNRVLPEAFEMWARTRAGIDLPIWTHNEPCKSLANWTPDTVEFPDGGLEIKDGDKVIAKFEPPDVEVVTDENGAILYVSLGPEAWRQVLEILEGE